MFVIFIRGSAVFYPVFYFFFVPMLYDTAMLKIYTHLILYFPAQFGFILIYKISLFVILDYSLI